MLPCKHHRPSQASSRRTINPQHAQGALALELINKGRVHRSGAYKGCRRRKHDSTWTCAAAIAESMPPSACKTKNEAVSSCVILHVARPIPIRTSVPRTAHRSEMVQQDLLPASCASGNSGLLHIRRAVVWFCCSLTPRVSTPREC